MDTIAFLGFSDELEKIAMDPDTERGLASAIGGGLGVAAGSRLASKLFKIAPIHSKNVDALATGLAAGVPLYFVGKHILKDRKKTASVWKDHIPGGLADKKTPADFDPAALKKGVKVELEHTSNKAIATEIAMDHLTEDGSYYDKLEKMEKKAEHPSWSSEPTSTSHKSDNRTLSKDEKEYLQSAAGGALIGAVLSPDKPGKGAASGAASSVTAKFFLDKLFRRGKEKEGSAVHKKIKNATMVKYTEGESIPKWTGATEF